MDLGGTNFRVIVMEITEEREFLMDSKIYAVPEDKMTGERERNAMKSNYLTPFIQLNFSTLINNFLQM